MQKSIFEATDMGILGGAIRDIREKAQLTAEELSSAAGSIKRSSLTRIELSNAQSASFDTIFRLLQVIGALPIIRNDDFDLRPYGDDVRNLILYFVRNDEGQPQPTYTQTVSKLIAESCDDWSKSELESLLLQVQCRNGLKRVVDKVRGLNQGLAFNRMSVEDIDKEGLFGYIKNSTDFIKHFRLFLLMFHQDGRYDEIFDLFYEMVDITHDYVCLKAVALNEGE